MKLSEILIKLFPYVTHFRQLLDIVISGISNRLIQPVLNLIVFFFWYDGIMQQNGFETTGWDTKTSLICSRNKKFFL